MSRPSTTLTEADVSVEERSEAERHDRFYASQPSASFYSLPYDDARYDAVIGQAILHHLREKGQVARELYRVLKPRARAIFSEPFGNSSWLERLRLLVPVPSGAPDDPTEWTRQLKYTDLEPFRSLFEIDVAEMQLLSRLERLVSSRRLVAWLKRLDVSVLRTCPWLRRYARTIVVELRRR